MRGKKELEVETLLTTPRFNIERVTHRLSDGTAVTREIVRHPGAVVIVPVLDDGRVCLIRNYRVAVNAELLELPAGTREPNESPIITAGRELLEETGYRAGVVEPLCELAMSPGILDERMHVFLARQLTAGDPEREVGEEIQNVLATPAEIDALIRENAIQDAKTIAALLYFFRYLG
jgi:ADP-ribose pyrophosphatase